MIPDCYTDPIMASTSNEPLYFFPDREVTREELQNILQQGSEAERCWAISHLLRFAQWDDIWLFVSREEVVAVYPQLDLPDTLRQAWARMLKIEEPVST